MHPETSTAKRSASGIIDPNILSISFKNRDLCTRCGTCIGVCPTGALSFDEKLYPRIDQDKCDKSGICGKTCPGGKISFRDLSKITLGHCSDLHSFDGYVQKRFVGYADDLNIRAAGSGGGVATAILWDLLRYEEVDGCVVTRMNPKNPWIGDTFIARTCDELLTSQGSKYMIIPVNVALSEIRAMKGRYAYAALPCQVHGFRLATEQIPELKQKIPVVIGLFCGGSLEPYIISELLKTKGLVTEDIKAFQFRGGEWPGKIRAVLKNGEIINMHHSNYKDGGYNYFIAIYMPKRCQTCIDGSNELADLSVSDAWTRDESGDYKFKAHSKILVRTDKGLEVINKASHHGTLITKDVSTDPSYRTHRIQTKRKGIIAPLRIARLKRKGEQVPIYDRQTPPATWKEVITERIVSLILWFSCFKNFRYLLIKFLTSKYAVPLIYFLLLVKKRKYRRNVSV